MNGRQNKDFCRLLLGSVCLVAVTLSSFAQAAKRRSSSAAFEQLTKRADAARQADKPDEAIKLYQQALQQNPRWIDGWWALGTMFYQLDRYGEGRAAFQRLVRLEPKGGVGWAFVGLCEYQLKNYQNALASLQRARVLGLGNNLEIASVARYHLGLLHNRFEQFELAFVVLQELALTRGESPTLIEALGLSLLRLPYLPEEIPADKREVVIKTGRAVFFMATNKVAEAEQEYKELLESFPATPGVHYAHGVFRLRDAPDEALQSFEQELKFSPQHVFARLQIAFEYIKRKDYNAALPYAEQAVKLAPNLFAGHNALGRVCLELGQTGRAIKELELGVKQAPDSPEMYFALARAYAKAGRNTEAEKARNEFTRLDKIRRAKKENIVGEKPEAAIKP